MVVFSDVYCDYFKLNNLQLNLQLIPNYFKNEKFVKLNTIITNDNVHEEVMGAYGGHSTYRYIIMIENYHIRYYF